MSVASPGLGEALYAKITSVPARRASSRVVEDAFALEQVALQLTPEMAAELEDGRGTIVHTATMFEQSQEHVDAYLSRIALVRTMLVALLARVVGYRGAIMGWSRRPGRPYHAAEATWWPVEPEARTAAEQTYLIEGT